MKKLFLLWCVLASAGLCRGAAFGPETTRMIADKYLAKEALPVLEKGFSMEEGLRAQRELVKLLEPKLGPVAGYKIGLITKAGQERMGASGPVHGTFLKKMLHYDNYETPVKYGVKPGLELDMGVIVGDDDINEATTLRQVIENLSYLVCFIELVDTITATNQMMDGALLTALNVGARGGVLGDRIRMSHQIASALPNMRMYLTDETGKVLADVPKLDIQPLENLVWLVADLKKSGTKLKKGDFISLGSPATIQPVVAGKTITLHYEGIGKKALQAKVRFKE
jgi:2-keto-4-pentenoate hydratase